MSARLLLIFPSLVNSALNGLKCTSESECVNTPDDRGEGDEDDGDADMIQSSIDKYNIQYTIYNILYNTLLNIQYTTPSSPDGRGEEDDGEG